ncbi:PREDICTED: uncharacterized protein LOC106818809 [Priapulus caudatus]|uniref:Uncharacterized protein LOC106818809 n=1 Tax=Priapulus caudatus TaxID=37621 RepID=A0ABM1F3E7_PRICU|nr:PREDICTED: uncharacterized protein LOC106818809 [Priapulus caudatus]
MATADAEGYYMEHEPTVEEQLPAHELVVTSAGSSSGDGPGIPMLSQEMLNALVRRSELADDGDVQVELLAFRLRNRSHGTYSCALCQHTTAGIFALPGAPGGRTRNRCGIPGRRAPAGGRAP